MPPPTTTRSKVSRRIAASASAREITPLRLRQEGRVRAQTGALGRLLLLSWRAQVQEPEHPLLLGYRDGGLAFGRAKHLGRAPVGSEAPAVCGEQDDVGGARGGAQILLVLDG